MSFLKHSNSVMKIHSRLFLSFKDESIILKEYYRDIYLNGIWVGDRSIFAFHYNSYSLSTKDFDLNEILSQDSIINIRTSSDFEENLSRYCRDKITPIPRKDYVYPVLWIKSRFHEDSYLGFCFFKISDMMEFRSDITIYNLLNH